MTREEYIRQRRLWEENRSIDRKSRYRPSPRYDEPQFDAQDNQVQERFWVRAVKFLLARDFDPVACVTSLFTTAGNSPHPPWPNHLVSTRNAELFSEATEASGVRVGASLVYQKNRCRLITTLLAADEGLRGADLFRRVLLDETLELSDLFRYCMAVSVELADVAAHFKRRALLQYLLHVTKYDQFWGELIPKGFRKTGEQAKLLLKGLCSEQS